ncbi:KPN_02809 family neutral zinc metallopeptidase [Thalassorhabdomicrobium marinisediminis]|uniref:KPN_02809 family neutral zinc metallopeptidase n=1 Tax=Thalassorhabdomicrobium marinisediminis TaxID=2170577 RepID=UPI002492A5D1|nr:neutral zinc metallopeptidase [Thalassorhabdomicrobium marinisediminis]
MKWRGRRGSRNIVDRRRVSGGRAAGGIGGVAGVLILLAGLYFGVDTSGFVDLGGGGSQQSAEVSPADERAAEFVSVTLADTEEVWADVFREQVDGPYNAPELVLFKGAVQSACGGATAQSGPFYCPADKRAYLDTNFFTTLEQRLGAGGDFAAAYVVAHEVAHHVQNELGILGQANQIRAQVSERESNEISVRIELQADCYSGIWARRADEKFDSLERGDIAEAMNAAAQIGDDTLQRNAGRTVTPHTFTHGTSEQRQRWFRTGYETGDLAACDTFGTDRL